MPRGKRARLRARRTQGEAETGSDDGTDFSELSSANYKGGKVKPTPVPLICFVISFVVRILSALYSPISDCDETYNYWEPTAFLMTGKGFQTWEYSPEYALRSYAYVLPHAIVGKILLKLQFHPISCFYAIRIMLAILFWAAESYFVSALHLWFSKETAIYSWIFMTISSGMFLCCAAYLPQTFVVTFFMFSLGSLIRKDLFLALTFFAIPCIIGWPFAVILGVFMALHMIVNRGFVWFTTRAAFVGICVVLFCCVIDYFYFGKVMIAPLNIILYNTHFSGGDSGQNLYGVEPWTYYVSNLWVNFSFAYLLMLISPFVTGLVFTLPRDLFQFLLDRNYKNSRMSLLIYRCAHIIGPCFVWYIAFTVQPHKEERFLFVIYPLIATSAALALTQAKLYRIAKWVDWVWRFSKLRVIFVISALTLSIFRSYGQIYYYGAPLQLWSTVDHWILSYPDQISHKPANVCVGKEWYRFPTSLFVNRGNVRFLRTKFDGQLPAPFVESTSLNPPKYPFNDANEFEFDGRVIPDYTDCDILVDLWEDQDDYVEGYDPTDFEVVKTLPFLARSAVQFPWRAYYVPYISDTVLDKLKWSEYMIFIRDKPSKYY